MADLLHALLIEDSESDADLVRLYLKKDGFELVSERVDTLPELKAALNRPDWDVIISDYNLPGFNAVEALALFKETGEEIPFIIVSGQIEEETAVELMRTGAADYLMKDKMARLAPVVRRELLEAKIRRERRETEIALVESNRRFRMMFDQSPYGVLVIDPITTQAIEFNTIAHNQLGYTREEFARLRIADYEVREKPKETAKHILDVFQNRNTSFETQHRTKFGKIRTISVTVQPLLLTNRTYLHTIFQDITEQKQAEADLKESEAALTDIFQSVNEGIVYTSLSGQVLEINSALEKMANIPKQEIIGMNIVQLAKKLFSDKSITKALPLLMKIIQGENVDPFEIEYADKILEVSSFYNKDSRHITGVIRDITERKLVEVATLRTEQRLRSLLDISQYETRSTQELLDFALEKAIQLTESKIGYIYFYDETKKEFTLNTWSKDVLPQCSVMEQQSVYQLEKTGFWGEVVRQRRALIDNDFQASHPLKKGTPEGHVVMKKFLTIPVIVNQVIVAVVGMANKTADYDATDELQLSLMMDSVWKIVEQTKTDEKLRVEAAALNAAANSIVITNKDGFVEWANPAFTNLTGYTLEEVTGKNLRDLVNSGQQSREFYQNLWGTILAGQIWHGEIINHRKDGTLYTEEMTITPILDAMGKICQFIAIKQNITERKLADQALRESEERFRKLSEDIPICINTFLPDSTILYANMANAALTGTTPEQIIGNKFYEMLNPEEQVFVRAGLEALTPANPFESHEQFHILPDGSKRQLEWRNRAFFDAAGKPTHYLAVGVDITERLQAEKLIHENAARLNAMVSNITDVIAIMKVDGTLTYKSPNIEKWFGWKPDDLVGTDGWETVHPADLERVQATFMNLIQIDGNTETIEYRYKCKDGSYRLIKLTAVNLIHDPVINGVLMNYHDVTEQRKAEETQRLTEEKFRNAFQTSPDSININRLSDGMYMDINAGFLALTGYTAEEVLGKTSLEINIWANPLDRQRLVQELRASGKFSNLEAPFRVKNGEIKTCLMSASLIEANGEPCILSITRDISERKQAEEALHAAHLHTESIITAANIGTWEWNVQTGEQSINEEWAQIIGYTRAELTPMSNITYEKLVHPADLKNAIEVSGQYFAGKIPISDYEIRLKHKDGRWVWVHSRGRLVTRTEDGKPLQMFGTHTDISDRKEAEEALHAAHLRTENIITAANIGTWEWNVQTGETVFNEKWAEIIGYTLAELAPISSKTWSKVTHPADLKQSDELIQKHFAGELPYYDFECRMKHKDGRWVWVLDRGQVITRSTDGKPLLMFGTHTDITERKTVEIEIIKNEIFLRSLLNTIPEPVIYQDSEGRFLRVNRALTDLLGLSEEELLGKTTFDLTPPDKAIIYHARDLELIHNGGTQKYESPVPDSHGIVHEFIFHKAAFLNQQNTVEGFISVLMDISDRKQMEETLRSSEERYRMLFEEMAEGFALHEIIVDENGAPIDYRFLDVNPAFEKQTGLKKEDIIGRTVKDVLPLTEDYWIQSYGQVALTGKALLYENFSQALGKWYQVTAFCPEFGQFASTSEDITERKKAEEKIEGQLDELRRWYKVTLGRESRIMELKQEVNQLHQKAGLPPRYASDSTLEQNHE
ncbi:MAG: PAS domain S-box protein [Leptolinea sp.]